MTFPVVRRLPVLLLLLAVVAALVAVSAPVRVDARPATSASAAADGFGVPAKAAARKDPRKTRGLFVDNRMKAANAGPAFARLGSKAQPLWITDYYKKPVNAKNAVKAYVTRAAAAKKTPLLVIYNIPDRDCGLDSAQQQQINDKYYRGWVAKAAQGIGSTKPIVILEPDAIAFIDNPDCSGAGNRLASIKYAVQKLTQAGAWVYIDAGHSGWHTAEHMAPLLKQAGIGLARGFATNVANTRSTGDEQTYAKALLKQLAAKKITGVKYVLDTSRNGSGSEPRPVNGDVCNPPTAQVGAVPRLTFKGAFDGNLWVKLPGESDGDGANQPGVDCHGGPSSGSFFPTGACRLMGTSASYYDPSTKTCR